MSDAVFWLLACWGAFLLAVLIMGALSKRNLPAVPEPPERWMCAVRPPGAGEDDEIFFISDVPPSAEDVRAWQRWIGMVYPPNEAEAIFGSLVAEVALAASDSELDAILATIQKDAA